MAELVSKKHSRQFQNIYKSLITALEQKGKPTEFMIDKIDEYMSLWGIKKQLEDAIGKTKAVQTYDNGGGQTGVKINVAVKELPKISRQMNILLDSLDLNGVVEDEDSGL